MGPTLTSTVGRDKVLKYAQTLTEVGDNRRFDDRAIGTGHQATHSRQLTNLRGGTPCARVRVHKDRVERVLYFLFSVLIDDGLFTDAVHHGLRSEERRVGKECRNW